MKSVATKRYTKTMQPRQLNDGIADTFASWCATNDKHTHEVLKRALFTPPKVARSGCGSKSRVLPGRQPKHPNRQFFLEIISPRNGYLPTARSRTNPAVWNL
jgi:hypothetical protein